MKQFSWGAIFRGAIFLGGIFPGGIFPGDNFLGGFISGGQFSRGHFSGGHFSQGHFSGHRLADVCVSASRFDTCTKMNRHYSNFTFCWWNLLRNPPRHTEEPVTWGVTSSKDEYAIHFLDISQYFVKCKSDTNYFCNLCFLIFKQRYKGNNLNYLGPGIHWKVANT